ncbi:MAG: nicotinamide-nucleotide amidohydrolase family protein, partial [Acidobacteriota bacterium]
VLRVSGLYESQVNELIKDLDGCIGVEIGYLPQLSENWITLFAAARTEAEARRQIDDAQTRIIDRVGAQYIIGQNDECLEVVIGQLLREKSWKMAAAESCTGGLFSRKITSVSGASDYFDRAFITYSNQAKTDLLGVPGDLLDRHGAVSEPVARAMAEGTRDAAGVDVSVSITGIAGPAGGSPEKPVGTVFIACAVPGRTVVERHQFKGDREHVRESAAQAALVLLWRTLSNDSNIYCS